jgi:hypothetical protein
MATVKPDPSSGGTALTRTGGPRQLTSPWYAQSDLHYSFLLSTGS